VELYVRNWRCIEEARLDLRPITIFIGKNASGKSSLAYAAYFLAKISEWRDVNKVARRLYGAPFKELVRQVSGEKFYPVEIVVGESRFVATVDGVKMPQRSPWSRAYLLPSQRIALIKSLYFLTKIVSRRVLTAHRVGSASRQIMALILLENYRDLLAGIPPTYFFIEDFFSLYGVGTSPHHYDLGREAGVLTENISLLFPLLADLKYRDPFVEHRLPIERAPDGAVDLSLVKMYIEKARKDSLLVIEEPEAHKNPLLLIEMVKDLEKAVEKRITLVITTHSDVILNAIAKEVETGRLSTGDVALYYLERSQEAPWTRVKKIEVYEDGTFEELPGALEVVSQIF